VSGKGMAVKFEDEDNKEINLLLSALKRLYIGTIASLGRLTETIEL